MINDIEDLLPKVSVITVCLNSVSGIEKTIQCVLAQSYPHLDYVVIDGGSTDGTVEIIQKYQSKISYWVSEKDSGISDAFNKGLKQSKGEYIAFLNSGDFYLDQNSIGNLVSAADGFDVVYGGIKYQRGYKPDVYPKRIEDVSYWVTGSIPHQSAMTSRKVFEKLGSFNLKRKYCMDYELYYRAYQAGFKFLSVSILITSVNCEGVSAKSWKAQLDEFWVVQKDLGATLIKREFYYYKRFVKMLLYTILVRLKILK